MKKISFLLFFLFSINNIWGYTIDSLINKSKEANNATWKNAATSAEMSKTTARYLKEIAEKRPSFSIGAKSGTVDLLKENVTGEDEVVSLTPTITFDSGLDNKTELELSSPLSVAKDTKKVAITPTVSINQTILVDPVYDSSDKLAYKKAQIVADYAYELQVLNYKKTVLNSIKNVYSAKKQLLTAKASYNNLKKIFDLNVREGIIKEGEQVYDEDKTEVSTAQLLYNTYKDLYKSYLESFKRITGLNFPVNESLEFLDFPTIKFEIKNAGNSEVQVKTIETQIAKLKWQLLDKNNSRKVLLGANGKLNIEDGTKKRADMAFNAAYSSDDFYLLAGTNINCDIENSNKLTPALNFSAIYTFDGSKTKDTIEVRDALLSLQNAQNEETNKLLTYLNEASYMKNRIDTDNFERIAAKNTWNTAKEIYNNYKKLNEVGYYESSEFEKLKASFEAQELTYWISYIDSLILECDAKILNL